MTVGIYIRVSTEEQVREGFSISAQREKLKAYCLVNDWEDFKFYVDEGISAKDTKRPQLQLMLKHISEGKINTVLVYKLDRLTRSVRDLYQLLETLEQHGCTFKSATELYDTSSAIGRLFITLVAAMAQWERENLGERVEMGQKEKARQGEFSATAPFGFKKVNDRLVPHAKEKDILLQAIDKYINGKSLREVGKYLDSQTPPRRAYKWHSTVIRAMFVNPALYGAIRWKDEIIENTHEGIITKEQFDHLQRILEKRKLVRLRKVRSVHIFQTKLVCPACGNHLTCERSKYERKDGSLYESNHYRCQICAQNSRPAVSGSERAFERAFVNHLENIDLNGPEIQPQNKNVEDQGGELKAQIVKLENQRAKYQKAWAADLISDSEFAERMGETKAALEDMKEQLNAIEPKNDPTVSLLKLKQIISIFKDNWSQLTAKEKRSFIQQNVEDITFQKDGRSINVTKVIFYP